MLQLLVAPVSHRRRSRSTASFLHPLGAVLVRRPPRVRLRRSLLAAAAAPAALERRWRPLHSVAASAAFARPSFDLRSVCGPEFTEPGFADGRFRIQGTEESSLSCTTRRGLLFTPKERISRISGFLITSSVGRAPEHSVLKPVQARLKICTPIHTYKQDWSPVRSGYA